MNKQSSGMGGVADAAAPEGCLSAENAGDTGGGLPDIMALLGLAQGEVAAGAVGALEQGDLFAAQKIEALALIQPPSHVGVRGRAGRPVGAVNRDVAAALKLARELTRGSPLVARAQLAQRALERALSGTGAVALGWAQLANAILADLSKLLDAPAHAAAARAIRADDGEGYARTPIIIQVAQSAAVQVNEGEQVIDLTDIIAHPTDRTRTDAE